MPSKLKKAIDAVKDQTSISIAKVTTNTSSSLDVAVLKATTHDNEPVNEKYVQQVLQLVSSNKFQAAACARAIGKRIGRTRSWTVALKSLMLVLKIFQDGDPYFPREVLHCMKRGAKILNLSTFRDDSTASPWDYTAFVRTIALYLDERLECFLTGKLQRRYTIRAKGISPTHRRVKSQDLKPAMLLDRISHWQRLLNRAIATRPTGPAQTNRLIQISLYAIVQESFELYKDISDGLTLILDSFFHLQFPNCVNAFEACVKATKQFKELSDFYSSCKGIGVGRSSEYPSVQTISEELIGALQEFLKDQSSCPINAKPKSPFPLPPAANVEDSCAEQSREVSNSNSPDRLSNSHDLGSRCDSLNDLINATETGTCPAISIDLEAYSTAQKDDSFRISDGGSTRSLPVLNSMVDLMSLWDWKEQAENETWADQQQQECRDWKEQVKNEPWENQQQECRQNKFLDSSSAFDNWELVLAETISSSSSISSKPISDTTPTTLTASTTFNSYPEQAVAPQEDPSTTTDNSTNTRQVVLFEQTLPPAPIQQPCARQPLPSALTDNSTNDWKVVLFEPTPPPAPLQQPCAQQPLPRAFTENSTNSWQVVLFEAAPLPTTPEPSAQPPLPNLEMPTNNHYNPFLQDPIEFPDVSNLQIETPWPALDFATPLPTFQAIPTITIQNPIETPFIAPNENDTFAAASWNASFSSEPTYGGSMDQQTLVLEQQLWLQNQNKIISKQYHDLGL